MPTISPAGRRIGARMEGVRLPVLEREHELAELAAAAREAAEGAGSVVLVSGEAGIGKSSLIEAAREVLPARSRLLIGYCDDLATRRALGPLRDLAGSVGTELSRVLDGGGDRNRLLEALRGELSWSAHPTVLAVEDVHWADEATLDVLRWLIRRVASLSAVLVLTYRDDEIVRDHPLTDLLGLISRTERVRRLPLRRLSARAVRRLSADAAVDSTEVYALTSGNPFFVSELLAAGDSGRTPPTVVDAVLARTRALDGSAQDALEQLAVIPSSLSSRLVDRLVPGGVGVLAEAERRGLLTAEPRRIGFRHELIRRAVADALPATRRIELHRRALTALLEAEQPDLAAIVHHAGEAGDDEMLARYAPRAAAEAVRAGAHREAVAHLRRALSLPAAYPPEDRAGLLDRYAVESYTTNDAGAALAAQREAVEVRRALADPAALGESLRLLTRIQWWSGHRDAAEESAREAIAVLEPAGDTPRLAMAYSNCAQIYALCGESADALDYGERAVALARGAGDAATLSHALNNIGLARWSLGDKRGEATLVESLRVALAAGEVEHACRAYVNIVWNLLDDARYAEAERYLVAGTALADRGEHLMFLTYLHVELGRLKLATGHWDEAVRAARVAAEDQPPARSGALVVLGRVGVRRGEPGATALLDDAWALAGSIREPHRTVPAVAARAEAALLNGGDPGLLADLRDVYDEVRRKGMCTAMAELAHWLARFGQTVEPGPADHPFALHAAGRWREAAAAWRAAGNPYQFALALADSGDPQDLLAALAEFDALGAQPMARRVRVRLRRAGVTHVPRGPAGATRANPAGLTARQMEVLGLLGQGMTNVEIAERLVVSVRTVDNHVAALLAKLGTHSRREAASRAAELGVTAPAPGGP
jgi:DNA-binding CsgD family transcriptional regulator/tetratricopeptide (TPR) repeat protein